MVHLSLNLVYALFFNSIKGGIKLEVVILTIFALLVLLVSISLSEVPSSSSMGGGQINNGLIPCDLGVMIIDEDPTSLLLMQTMLTTCNYRVASFGSAREALYALWERQGEFDLVIIEIHMDSINGFNLLHRIVSQLDIPVITMCSDDDPQLQRQAIFDGAYFHLVKPINMTKMEVVLQKGWRNKGKMIELVGGKNSSMKKKNSNTNIVNDDVEHEHKRPRLQWDRELHHRFLLAVRLLGDDAIPTKIIHVMNIEGLTNKQISSHLQKYRKRLAKLKQMDEKGQSACLLKEHPYARPTSLGSPVAPEGSSKKLSTKKNATKFVSAESNQVCVHSKKLSTKKKATQEHGLMISRPIENTTGSNEYSNVELAAKNNSEKERALDADDDWAGLDDFLGLNEQPTATDYKENVAAGEGTLVASPFDFDFEIENLDLDDDFLAQIMKDKK